MGDLAKSALYDQFALVGKAFSNGRRAELVDVLAQGERSVDALAEQIGQSSANTSQHLQVLARSGLVLSRRDGNRVLYRLGDGQVEALWEALRAWRRRQLPACTPPHTSTWAIAASCER
jgi:DNA-binding transcriptional ArsR family regulator